MAAFTSCVPLKNYVDETDLEYSRHSVSGVSSLDETVCGIPTSGKDWAELAVIIQVVTLLHFKETYINTAHLWWMHMHQNNMTSRILRFQVFKAVNIKIVVQGYDKRVVLYESLYYKTVQCHNPIVVQ